MDLCVPGIALVVGAGQGIGKAAAITFAEAGVRGLVLANRTEQTLLETAEEAKAVATNKDFETLVVPTDITKEASIDNLIAKAVEKFGAIHYCANVSGSFGPPRKPFASLSNEEWDETQKLNVDGMFHLMRKQIQQMLTQERVPTKFTTEARPAERGSIVVVSSGAALISLPGATPYCTAKSATFGMAKSAAFDHAGDGIRINAMLPGYVATPGLMAFPGAGPEMAAKICGGNPLHRFGDAKEIGDMIVMMASPRNSFMCGSGIVVDGGQSLTVE